MAVKAAGSVTVASITDVASTTRYYLLQSSTLTAPAKPTASPPGGSWVATEPTYTSGSTNSLYTCDLTTFSDGTWSWSDVSLSSSYEAAKQAYNAATAATTAASTAQADIDGLTIGGTNLCFVGADQTFTKNGLTRSLSDGVFHISGTNTAAAMWQFPNVCFRTKTLVPGASYTLSTSTALPSGLGIQSNQRGTTWSKLVGWNGNGTVTSRTAQAVADADGYLNVFLFVLASCGTVDVSFSIKLERGTRATDWSPAPEDKADAAALAVTDANVATAQSTADAAQTAADSATTAASTAQTTADAAKSTADAAQTQATTTAQHFWSDADGAHVSTTADDGLTGGNTLLTSDGLQVRSGTDVLSSFSDDTVELGKNSKLSEIKMCGDKLSIRSQQTGKVYGNTPGYRNDINAVDQFDEMHLNTGATGSSQSCISIIPWFVNNSGPYFSIKSTGTFDGTTKTVGIEAYASASDDSMHITASDLLLNEKSFSWVDVSCIGWTFATSGTYSTKIKANRAIGLLNILIDIEIASSGSTCPANFAFATELPTWIRPSAKTQIGSGTRAVDDSSGMQDWPVFITTDGKIQGPAWSFSAQFIKAQLMVPLSILGVS